MRPWRWAGAYPVAGARVPFLPSESSMTIRLRKVLSVATAGAVVVTAAVILMRPAEAAITSSQLVNPISGKCLDVTGNSNANGTQVELWTCKPPGNNNQRWVPNGSSGGGPTADELLAKVTSCSQISNGKYKTDSDVSTATVAVCQKTGAVFWKADMDIDCDGIRTTQCNETTDPWFQPDTFCHTSTDTPLNSAALPYVVVPSPSSIWDYRNYSIGCGTVVAVIYNNRVEYAVVGDTGPTTIIGE